MSQFLCQLKQTVPLRRILMEVQVKHWNEIRRNGYIATLRKARTGKKCSSCGFPIEPGQEYYEVVAGGGGLGERGGADMVTKEKENKAIIQVGAEERKLTITFDDVKKYLCPKASDAEIGLFLKTCKAENLNPFKREAFLVKYGEDQPAAIIIATETFVKAAESCPEYDGVEAGIILKNSAGELKFREGAFLLDEEAKSLVGGWAKVYRKDRSKPTYAAVNIKECIKYTRTGKPTRFWEDMPATMVRKVALSRALREAFPNRFGGTLTTAEFEEIPEGQLPPAFEKNGKSDWRHLYAKIRTELGITPEQAHELLSVESFKDAGWTPGRVWDELVKCLKEQQSPSAKHEEIIDVQTGETITQDEDLFGESEVKADEAWNELAREAEVVETETKKSKRDPETIKTIAELYRACHEDFELQPKEVLKELGYSSQADITETPAECYRKIAAVRG